MGVSDFLSQLQWRYAIKAFDTTKKISASDLNKIFEAIRMAPSSYGLQPYYVKVVEDQTVRQKLYEAGYKQNQFLTASQIFVFITTGDVGSRIDGYERTASVGLDPKVLEGLKAHSKSMRDSLLSKSPEHLRTWASEQAHIALGFALAACAELAVDSCPMGGFSGPDFDKILQLPQGDHSTVVLTIGYRDPAVALRGKVRFEVSELIQRIS